MARISSFIGKLPRALGDMPSVVHEDALLILGGASGMESHDEILRVDPSGKASEVGRLPRACRGHQAVKVGNIVYVLGGFSEGTLTDAYQLDLRDLKARKIAPMPRDSAWFTAVLSGEKIFVVGGFSIPDGYWKDVATYDPARDVWSTSSNFPKHIFPKSVLGSNAAAAVGGRILSFGGADTFDSDSMRANALDTCAVFDPKAEKWERLSMKIEPREGLVPVAHGDRVFLVGGMPNPPEPASNLVEVIDATSLVVESFARLHEGRAAAACGVIDGQLVVAGGVTEGVFAMTDTIEAIRID